MKKYLSSVLIILFFVVEQIPKSNCVTKYLGIELTDDISNVNCNNGTIYNFQLSFNCNRNTLNRIINKHHLVKCKKEAFVNTIEYDWWDNYLIKQLNIKYISKANKNHHSSGPWMSLFYDKKHSKVYIFRYDL